jgi:hypothetical protein
VRGQDARLQAAPLQGLAGGQDEVAGQVPREARVDGGEDADAAGQALATAAPQNARTSAAMRSMASSGSSG